MRTLLLRLLGMVALLFTLTASAENEIYYGVYQGNGTLTAYGTDKAETYDIAIHLSDPSLVGAEIKAIRIPVNTKATNVKDYKGWLTKELTLASGKLVADIVTADATVSGSWAEAVLAEPYVIEEGGLYVGYSLTVSSVDTDNDNDPNKKPIMVTSVENPEGLLIHTNRTFRKWAPLADVGSPAVLACLGGDFVKGNAATFVVPNDLYNLVGKNITAQLTLVNHGANAIKNIEYEIELNGKTETKTVSKSLSGGYYGRSTTLSATIPAVDVAGAYDTKFRITKINGEANEDPQAEATTPVVFLNEVPLHKPLVEEYTGTWCQYCPRALAGMEKMADANGEDFVGVAYHVQDEMEFSPAVYLPADPSGLPSVFIDRVKDFAPLNGQSDWESRRKIIAPAAISVVGEWADEGKTKIKATSTTTFIRNFVNNPYRVGYILIANDLHSTEWKQSNALSGTGTIGDPYYDKYCKSSNPIRDLHYNEVALAQSAQMGAGLPESLPAEVKGDNPYTHEFVFDISKNNLPLDKTKLEVIAVLIDTATGEVKNCNKGHVGDATGIEEVKNVQCSMFNVQSVYDLAGRRVMTPTKGIYIQNGKKVVK